MPPFAGSNPAAPTSLSRALWRGDVSGTVDIVVLSPVLTAEWTCANLCEKIEELRAMCNDTLQNLLKTGEAA